MCNYPIPVDSHPSSIRTTDEQLFSISRPENKATWYFLTSLRRLPRHDSHRQV
jgi:hypothetical protein